MKRNILTILLCAGVSCLTAYAVTSISEKNVRMDGVAEDAPAGAQYRTVSLNQSDYPDFTYAAESAVDAVVFVKVTIKQQVQAMPVDPFFQFFFGQPQESQPRERVQQGSGSGVIIREDGYIVTNNHVVNGATTVEVTLNNNQTYEAKVIGTDPDTDIALIKIEAENLPVVPLGDSDNLRLGEWVLAIGSPYSLRSTVTAGIVSAKARSMGKSGGVDSFIQTDAAVNPGNSGGALVNRSGELVGINTMIYSQTGSYSGYSFAVPVNVVKKVIADLIDFGSVKRAYLGVYMRGFDNLDPENSNKEVAEQDSKIVKLLKDLKLSGKEGVYIVKVIAGSAADKAGVKEGDILLEIDGNTVVNAASLQEKVSAYHPGDKATVKLNRNGKEMKVEVVFQSNMEENGSVDEDGAVAFYGAKLKALDSKKAEKLGIKKGVEVVGVSAGKMKEEGAEEGLIILYVNDTPVSKPQDVVDIAAKSRRMVAIEGVYANGKPAYFAFGKDDK
ncbi:MAG: Do family serine endopeptidase [Bacteroidales bacterium]|nr:Do family serine endopeptidase [Bacteroidales bacterium]